jgi:hypothetical protein
MAEPPNASEVWCSAQMLEFFHELVRVFVLACVHDQSLAMLTTGLPTREESANSIDCGQRDMPVILGVLRLL